MRVARSLAAVAAGYAVMAVILRVFAPAQSDASGMNYFMLSLTWTVVGAMAGGYVAAFIAGSRELAHAAGVGFLMIVMSIVSMRRQGASHPGWYETSIAGCGPIASMVGAAIRMLTRRGRRSSP